jgi:hypothetical protein
VEDQTRLPCLTPQNPYPDTGGGWSLRTLTLLWTHFLLLWTAQNEAIHGHDLASQHHVRKRQLRLEMELLHAQRDQVLACDTDVFMGDTPAELTQFIDILMASHVQNWLHVWKPFIISSINSAKDLSIHGV